MQAKATDRITPGALAPGQTLTETELLECVRPWGYCLEPKFHPRGIGFSGLLVAIRPQPTEAHYDPESVTLRLRDDNGTAQWVTLHQRPPFTRPVRVCPGHIMLNDRREKKVEFFTFGGEIRPVLGATVTAYAISSPVPILGITPPSLTSAAEKLALKAETVLARADACWERDHHGFLCRLGEVDPVVLYAAILQDIANQNAVSPARSRTLSQAARREMAWLEETERRPPAVPSLSELLCP